VLQPHQPCRSFKLQAAASEVQRLLNESRDGWLSGVRFNGFKGSGFACNVRLSSGPTGRAQCLTLQPLGTCWLQEDDLVEALKKMSQSAPQNRAAPGPAATTAGELWLQPRLCNQRPGSCAPGRQLASAPGSQSVLLVLQADGAIVVQVVLHVLQTHRQRRRRASAAGRGPPWGACPPAAARPTF
jgi:hypothetical protein